MYWREIPLQIQARDGEGQVSRPLDPRFQEGADAVSMLEGSSGTDDYLAAFAWGDYAELDGSAEEVASSMADEFNRGFPGDFVARIRDLHQAGSRDTSPGAIDDWKDDGTD
jgi:hypothetical protein